MSPQKKIENRLKRIKKLIKPELRKGSIMTIPENPIGKRPKDPYEDYKTERLYPEKQEKEKFEEEHIGTKTVGALILLYFKRLTDFFTKPDTKTVFTQGKERKLREALVLFKAALEAMQMEDKSQDLPFLKNLAEFWSQIVQDSSSLKNNPELFKRLNFLLKEIEIYPKNDPHTLGYYLKEGAGLHWIPFPYMDLIQKLYKQAQKDPTTNPVFIWVQEIQNILGFLEESYG